MEERLQQQLLDIAEASIRYGLDYGRPLAPEMKGVATPLREPGASFVTLKSRGELRGCIGSLNARRPLAVDVAENAYAAAFSDLRFPPLREQELEGLGVHLSILGPAEPMRFSSEADLLQQLRPGVDGLVLEDGLRRGTFLPSVWEQLPRPELFLRHLKQKAGLPPDYWSETLQISRYTTESFGRLINS
ncbi:MAG: AmmeMemoRadiSam system protein A, partial [Gammaproteobacteria bacterium]|nr:AmmeMemoRadiSam system protein A [Gammaproteobacteria bacterium]MCW8928486.1 AmmeMemoRadiSam system protein A [Gammaproteobacteria bacterium]MCW8957546.1 AmmeMemoRadiSam system protein A [Gammaproteobacteria bacterium]